MSDYVLKTYDKGYEDIQAKVGIKVANNWINAHQTPVDRLKDVYSQPGFDPETRHYCFKGDKMVGFLTSKVLEEKEGEPKKASLVFPSVLPDHEEATDLLIKKALTTLKDKGVEEVETYASALCGNQVELANKHGFTYVKDTENIVFTLKVENIDENVSKGNLRKFDKEKDLEAWLKLVEKYDAYDEDQLERIKKEIVEDLDSEFSLAHFVIEEEGEIVGTSLVYRNPIKPNSANLAHTYFEDLKYLEQLVAKAAKVAKKENIDYFLIWLFGNRLPFKKDFAQLNTNYAQPYATLFNKKL